MKKRREAIKSLLFIFEEFSGRAINEKELREDANNINMPEKYIDYFLEKVKDKKSFYNKARRKRKSFKNTLLSVD